MTKTFKFRVPGSPVKIALPSRPQINSGTEEERLTGQVDGMTASAGEERLAKAFDDAGIQYQFRYVVGAPKGLPGWKELDFVVMRGGMVYTVEVDTAFTHRGKEYADVLHDAIVLNDKEIKLMGQVWPSVIHVDGESDLASKENASAYVRQRFGK